MSHCFKNRDQNKTIQGPSRDSHGQELGVAAHPLWGTPLFSPCPTVSQDLASLTPITVAVGPGGGLPAFSEATAHSLPWGLSKFCSLTVLLLSQQWACPLLICGGSLPFPLLIGGRLSFLRGVGAPPWGRRLLLLGFMFLLPFFLPFYPSLIIYHLPIISFAIQMVDTD